MYKGLVAKGAHTSTGGRVLSGSSTQYDDEGRSLAVDLDYATYGTCGVGPFRIYGSVSDWTDEGRNMVKDLDPVNCPCGKNRVFALPSTEYLIDTGSSKSASATAASPTADLSAFDQSFILRDERSGKPLAGFLYRIVGEDGTSTEQRTDAQGQTVKVSGAQSKSVTLHVLEEFTPIDPAWDKYL
jgi:hypothetical protein